MSASPLEIRYKDFARLANRFECLMLTPLIAVYQIPLEAFEQLRISTAIYLSKCLRLDRIILDEYDLLDLWVRSQDEIENVTPNGMIVPKRHLILEYNQLVKDFIRIINFLNIGDLVSSWHIPLNLRYKAGKPNEGNMVRHHPTEHIHTDSWAGESAESVTTMINIFGDIDNNHVSFYHPPAEFEEDWLGPKDSYKDGNDIAKIYKRVEYAPSKGQLIVADFSSMHCSTRLANAGARISIDTTFALKRVYKNSGKEIIHQWREEERASHELLSTLGEENIFVFPDTDKEFVDSEGGFKHPTNLRILPLFLG